MSWTRLRAKWQVARKFGVGALGVAAQVATAGLPLPESWKPWAAVVVAAATAAGVYATPNRAVPGMAGNAVPPPPVLPTP